MDKVVAPNSYRLEKLTGNEKLIEAKFRNLPSFSFGRQKSFRMKHPFVEPMKVVGGSH